MGEKEGNDGGDKKPEGGAVKVLLKVNMHCDGCAKKVKRAVCGFEGVEYVATDNANNMLTVVGKLDPWKLREKVEQKTHKNVVIISPLEPPKKEEKKPDVKPKEVKVEEKPKSPTVNTVILKFRLHCDGCIQRIRRAIHKIKGVQDVEFDAQKDLVFVKGTMDANTLSSSLETKFKKKIEVVPFPKKEEGGGEKDRSIGGNEDGGDKKGGEKKKDKDDDRSIVKKDDKVKEKKDDKVKEKKDEGKQEDGEKKEVDGEPKFEFNRMEYNGSSGSTSQYYHSGASTHYFASSSSTDLQYFHDGGDATRAYMPYGYPIDLSPAPQLFSDENPNGCSVM